MEVTTLLSFFSGKGLAVRQIKWIICFLLLLASSVSAGDLNKSMVDEAVKRSNQCKKALELSDSEDIQDSRAMRTARKMANKFYSADFQKQIAKEVERLKTDVFSEVFEGVEKRSKSKSADSFLLEDERLYIFISSSVPVSTLRTYVSVIDQLKDPRVFLVMRGMVGGIGSMTPTIKFFGKLLAKDVNCDVLAKKCESYRAQISIDPSLFPKYGIENVPAIAYVKGVSLVDAARSEGEAENLNGTQNAYIVYGDVSVERGLEIISRETKNKRVNKLLEKVRKGVFYQ